MKLAIYVRNSTTEDKQNPETQLKPLREYCDRFNHSYTIFQEFASGSKQSRPELDNMLKRIRSGEFDGIIVWKLDRLGRSLQHLLQLIEEFKNKRIIFISLTENFDTSTPQGNLFLQLIGAFAEFERNLTMERIKAGTDRARSEGKTFGRPKGVKDGKIRRKSGYYQRWSKKF
jgi:DNA invertase Pin-like site-specific DNA recombinase